MMDEETDLLIESLTADPLLFIARIALWSVRDVGDGNRRKLRSVFRRLTHERVVCHGFQKDHDYDTGSKKDDANSGEAFNLKFLFWGHTQQNSVKCDPIPKENENHLI